MNTFRFVLFIALISLISTSCRKKLDSGEQVGAIKATMVETLDSTGTGRHLVLNFATIKVYACCNFNIKYEMMREGNVINIRFGEVNMPPMCLTSLGPATAQIDLGVLPTGTYTLNLVSGITNISTLTVDNNQCNLSPVSGSNISYTRTTLLKVPENTIWGYVCFDSTGTSPALLNTFFDSLSILGAQNISFTPGDYGFFQLNAGNAFPHRDGCLYSRQFIYKYTASLPRLKQLVWNYWGLSNQTFYINLHTDMGYNYMSWYQH